jgi:hypothetical protein
MNELRLDNLRRIGAAREIISLKTFKPRQAVATEQRDQHLTTCAEMAQRAELFESLLVGVDDAMNDADVVFGGLGSTRARTRPTARP